MNKSLLQTRRLIARLCLGGSLFVGLLTPGSCASNAAYTNLATNVGQGAIGAVAANAAEPGSNTDAIVVQPLAGFLGDLWTAFVSIRIPADPVFQNDLLVR